MKDTSILSLNDSHFTKETLKSNKKIKLPLLNTQLGIWLAEQMSEQKNAYVIAHYVDLKGDANIEQLIQAISIGLKEVDILHCDYIEKDVDDAKDDESAFEQTNIMQLLPQSVNDSMIIPPEVIDVSHYDEPCKQAKYIMQSDINQTYDINNANRRYRNLLIKVCQCDNSQSTQVQTRWYWYQRYHHLMMDGFGFTTLTQRITAIYNQLVNKQLISESPFKSLHYVIDEYQKYQTSPKFEQDKAFWKKYSSNITNQIELSTKKTQSLMHQVSANVLHHKIEFDEAVIRKIVKCQNCTNATDTEVVMALVLVYLQRMTQRTDITVGFPLMRRIGSAALFTVGPVVNVLPLQVHINGMMTFREAVSEMIKEIRNLRRHQKYDAENLQRDLGLVGSHQTLYGPILNFKMFDYHLNFAGVPGETYHLAAGPIDDLEFSPYIKQGKLFVEFSANAEKYSLDELKLHGDRFCYLLEQVIMTKNCYINELSLINEKEGDLISHWSEGGKVKNANNYLTVLDVLYQTTQKIGGEVAIQFEQDSLTYEQLSEKINQFSRYLIDIGVGYSDCVAIALPRSMNSIVCLLSILNTGAAYLPLDLDYPDERILMMLQDAQPTIIISISDTKARLEKINKQSIAQLTPIVCIDNSSVVAACEKKSSSKLLDGERKKTIKANHPAYIIYTSGSTGKPKGVINTHQALVNLLLSHSEQLFVELNNNSKDSLKQSRRKVAHSTSFSFDASWELIIAMLLGHELYILSEELRQDSYAMVQQVIQNKIDILDVPPTFLSQMLEAGLMASEQHKPSLILIGSEAVSTSLWQQLREFVDLQVFNFYGPTEYTVDAVFARVKASKTPVIGRPIANTKIYVLDEELKTVPIGCSGELYLSGIGMAKGYFGKAALTASRFVANPFESGCVMYRTGDWVRWLPDGKLEFLGRCDNQVKVRGFRIELGEIESVLNSFERILDSVVTVQEWGGSNRLIAYCVVSELQPLDINSLRQQIIEQLKSHLPTYMIPASLMLLDKFPLTVNGKVDQSSLPAPQFNQTNQLGKQPKTQQEKLICQSISQLLNIDNVFINDDFFNLGGDSISAMGLSSLLRKDGYSLKPKDIFALRTAEKMISSLTLFDSKKVLHKKSIQAGCLSDIPIIRWYEKNYGLKTSYVQGVFVRVPDDVETSHLQLAMQALVKSHAILRAYVNGSELIIREDSLQQYTEQVYLVGTSKSLLNSIDEIFEDVVSSIKPSKGNMLQISLLKSEQGESGVLIAAHHLIIDGVSWRILLPELQQLTMDAVKGNRVFLPVEENSVLDWQECLRKEIKKRQFEFPHWEKVLTEPYPLIGLRRLNKETDVYGNAGYDRKLFSAERTQKLLTYLPQSYRTTTEELLLSLIVFACVEEFAVSQLRFSMESHGRHQLSEDIDISRTLGWFTAEYPIAFDLSENNDKVRNISKHSNKAQLNLFESTDFIKNVIKTVKHSMRAVKDSGIGYGLLRYIDQSTAHLLDVLESKNKPEILFNYLGRFYQTEDMWTPQTNQGQFADAFAVSMQQDMSMIYGLEINVFIDESNKIPQLAINWIWAEGVFSQEIVERLNKKVENSIDALVNFSSSSPMDAIDTLVAAETNLANFSEDNLSTLIQHYGPLSDVLPVLPLQAGLLFHTQLGEQASNYNSVTRLDFQGCIDVEKLRQSLDAVLIKFPQLGAVFDNECFSEPLQLLPLYNYSCGFMWPFYEHDLTDLPEHEQEKVIAKLQKDELAIDFMHQKSEQKLLLNARLIHYAKDKHQLLISAHHLVVDGWSTPILLQDFFKAYLKGATYLQPTKVNYSTVVKNLSTRDMAPAIREWKRTIQNVSPCLLYGENSSRGEVRELELYIDTLLAEKIDRLCRERGLTLNSIMQGVWASLLGMYSGRDDVVFGTPVSGRFSSVDGIDEHIGLFSNTIPVRIKLNAKLSLLKQLNDIQQQQINLLEYDGLGLAEIQRIAGGHTLFDTLLVVENYPDNNDWYEQDYHGMKLTQISNRGHTHYPLTILVLPGEKLKILFEYRDAVKEPHTLADTFISLLEQVIAEPELPLSQLQLQTKKAINLIQQVNNTQRLLADKTLRDLMIEQAEKTPDSIALIDMKQQLTYQQMRQKVCFIANQLIERQVKVGNIVAIALPRSAELSLAINSVIEVGAAYLPLDVGYPNERLQYMINDAKPKIIITTCEFQSRFENFKNLIFLDDILKIENTLTNDSITNLSYTAELKATDPAYIIYTSGSTGRPKGVLVSHGAIVNRLLWMQNEYQLTTNDVILQKTPCSFDVSVWEFFWAYIQGARLVMAPPEVHREPEALLRMIEDFQVTTMHFVPSMLATFLSFIQSEHQGYQVASSLRQVFCSGEALSKELAFDFSKVITANLHNLYGPTEAAVDVTYFPAVNHRHPEGVFEDDYLGVPIGKPVWNTQLRILDHYLREVPIGVAGELYLTGNQLALGYFNRSSLTAERFVADPYAIGERMYRTGDIVRWSASGDVEYIGRSDDQLKIRGQRIELGEIENAILNYGQIKQAVVHARVINQQIKKQGDIDSRQLVGYVIANNADEKLDTEEIKQYLSSQLPSHMVPVAIIAVDHFPLSANGKLDRKSLPDPVLKNTATQRALKPGLETLLAERFANILQLDTVGVYDDFFTLGGHSLLAMRLAAELRRELNMPVSVGQIMVSPTIEQLALILSDEERRNDPANAGFGDVMPIRRGEGTPLFCINPASGFAWQYTGLTKYLKGDFPIIGLQSPRPDGAIASSEIMDQAAESYLKLLQRIQPQGPYHLLGYSFGGTIAQALAVKLKAQGEIVAFLGLLDTYPPEGQDWSGPTEQEAQVEVEREKEQFMMAAEGEYSEMSPTEEQAKMFDDIVANYEDSVRLLSKATTQYYAGEATIFVAEKTLPEGMCVAKTWAPFIQNLKQHRLNCSHEDIIMPEPLKKLGPLLNEIISKVESLE